jgi:hypothetical protein
MSQEFKQVFSESFFGVEIWGDLARSLAGMGRALI